DYTGENPAAWGGVTHDEVESLDGRERSVNVNGRHIEVGPWTAPLSVRIKMVEERKKRAVAVENKMIDDVAKKNRSVFLVLREDVVKFRFRGDTYEISVNILRQHVAAQNGIIYSYLLHKATASGA